jgi:glycosyltransferase involved in cell wall biosynthesis
MDSQQRRPTLSVGLPVSDAEGTLATALTSIRCQTYADWELLVLDDFSEDASQGIALEIAEADPRVRVLAPRGPQGLVPRLNEGISAARGQYFARMDADDVAYPTRFEEQLKFLQGHPSVDVVGTSILVFRGDGIPRGVREAASAHDAICSRPRAGFKLFHPTWMGKIKWFRDYGYRTSARGWEDQELLFRAFRDSCFANLRKPLLGYREDRIPLRRATRARADYAKIVIEYEAACGRYGHAIATVFEQTAKALAEITAIGLGLEDMLRNRATPATSDSLAEWRDIWLENLRRTRELTARPGSVDSAMHYGAAPPRQ